MSQSFLSWDQLPALQVSRGDVVRVVIGEELQVIRSEVDPGVEFEVHSHRQEQMIVVLEGALHFVVGNEQRVVRAGDVIRIAPDVPHGGRVHGEQRALLLEVFHPIRTEIGHGSNRVRIVDGRPII